MLRLLALMAALQLIGGHWVMLQTTAWVGMAFEFTKDASVAEAVSKTLDGQHPCKLCHAVKKGRSEEKKRELSKSAARAEALLVERVSLPLPGEDEFVHANSLQVLDSRREAPPHGPPLAA